MSVAPAEGEVSGDQAYRYRGNITLPGKKANIFTS